MEVAAIAVIPLLITLVLIALLGTKSSIFSLRHNIQFWLVTGYILLLLAAPAFILLLPAENLADGKMKTVSEMDVAAEMTGQEVLYTQALQGRPEQAERAFVLEQWEFPCQQGSMIEIMKNPAYKNSFTENGVTIVAERKDRADGMIEVINYATRTIVEGFDFSERVRPYQAALHGNVLQVTGPQRLEVVLGMFSRESVAAQILGEDNAMLEHGSRSIHTSTVPGSQLLYLRIPADVEVQSDIYIAYVEK